MSSHSRYLGELALNSLLTFSNLKRILKSPSPLPFQSKHYMLGTVNYKPNIDLILKSILLQMKSSIVKQISAIRVETVERIQQMSNVIAEATSVVGEVTFEAQVCLPTLISLFMFSYSLNVNFVRFLPFSKNSTLTHC